jgi:hypothetical protein
MLHASNNLVRQAENAEAIERFVRGWKASGVEFYFVRPNERAWFDTTYGMSITTLHADEGLRASFAGFDGAPDRFHADQRRVLVAFDDVGSRAWEAHALEHAQWKSQATLPLEPGLEVVQPLPIRRGVVGAVHVLSSAPGPACALEYRLTRPLSGDATNGAENDVATELARGRIECAALQPERYVAIEFAPVAVERGSLLALHLRLSPGGSAVALLSVSPEVPGDLRPFRLRDTTNVVRAQPAGILTYRVVLYPSGPREHGVVVR